ncbi:uncharacterized protein LOC110446104 [Mizuhopecten yessoensis]|uniref:uncharacterized protein LOC110446104 n=1 Tax=Mizuhopecten yessoensis TaxID=6573 RepID=UPI000B459C5B|nr:uncharacterized protein LOC110446104 [Mizuhopecten yessoensis]
MLLYEAERDMMGILMLSNGVINRLTQEVNNNGENHAYDVEITTATIGKITTNGNLILDEVLAACAVDTLNNMLHLKNTVGKLTTENKMKIGDSYKNIANSLENHFKSSMASDEKQDLAKDLLNGVIKYAQTTKYSAECSLNTCQDQLAQGQYVIDFISITHKISAILLEDTVPGEGERVISIPIGNTVLSVQRQEILEVVNATLYLEGQAVADVPDLSGSVDLDVLDYIDVEIMLADNLYTTDTSSTQVRAQTTGIALHVDGEVLQVANLLTPIKIRSYPHILPDLTFTPANLSSDADTNLFYIQLSVNESNITPVFILRSQDQNVILKYYVKVGSPPTKDDYDVRGLISSLDLQDVSGNGTLWQAIIQLTDTAIATALETSSTKLVYLGLHTETGRSDIQTDTGSKSYITVKPCIKYYAETMYIV